MLNIKGFVQLEGNGVSWKTFGQTNENPLIRDISLKTEYSVS